MAMTRVKTKRYVGIYENSLKNGKKSFYIQYTDETGTTRTRKCNAADKDEALQILNDKKDEVRKIKQKIQRGDIKLNQQKQKRTLTLDQYADIFHPKRENKDTEAERKMYVNHISPLLGKKKIDRLTKDNLIEFRKKLQAKEVVTRLVKKDYANNKETRVKENRKLKPKTIKSLLDYLRVILNNAVDDGYAESTPLDFSEFKDRNKRIAEKKKIYGEDVSTSASDVETGRVLTDDELNVLWNIDDLRMNDRLFLFLKACYFTGARPAGVIDVRIKDINFATKRIRIKAMKKGKSYEARVPDELLDLLKRWIAKYDLSYENYVFFPLQSYFRAGTVDEKAKLKNKAANYGGYRRLLQKIMDPVFNVGTDPYDRMNRINVYSMRRTAATRVYEKHGIVHAKQFLNHTDIKTTMHYLNVDNDMQEIDYGL